MIVPLSGLVVLAIIALIFALRWLRVRVRANATRGGGVRVYDLGADLDLPARKNARSYQIALYLTMKSRSAETVEPPITTPAASP